MDTIPNSIVWLTSSHSTAEGQCVQAGSNGRRIAVRDSKHPDAPWLSVSRPGFAALVTGIKAGHHG